jgi:anti-sigma-K factor RskA
MTDHERWEDAAGSYVLNALTDDERVEYEAHLASCPECRAEVSELRVAAEALPVSPPPMVPPPALKARIMAEVEREAALLASAGKPDRAHAPEPKRRERRRLGSGALAFPRAALGALACALVAVGIGVGALLFAGGSGARTIPFESTLQQASAELELTDDGATLTANGLPPTAPGKTYMVWIQRKNGAVEPTSAFFTPGRDGSATASMPGEMKDVKAVLVNTEPVGGSRAPTSKPVLTASLS